MAKLLLALALGSTFFCLAHTAIAGEYCSLTIRVEAPDGAEENGALVQIAEEGGRVIQEHYKLGGLRFCDLGILPVTVTIGPEGSCNQVTVRNVTIRWDKIFDLKVTYDPRPCQLTPAPPPSPICEILFRVTDGSGWVAGPTLRITSPSPATVIGDRFGRVRVVAKVGTEVNGSLAATGYAQQEVSVSCTAKSPLKIEQGVTLKAE